MLLAIVLRSLISTVNIYEASEASCAINLTVSSGGSDSGHPQRILCGTPSTYFQTLAAAVAALPPISNYPITINFASSTTFTGLTLQNHSGNGKIRISGATQYATITPTTGPATGTAASGTSTTSLKNPGSNWTAHNLRGHLLVITSGGGSSGDTDAPSTRVILDNTTTTATINTLSGLASGSVFKIVDPGVTISQTATPINSGDVECIAASDNSAPIEIIGVHPTDSSLTNGIYLARNRKVTMTGLKLDTNAAATVKGEANIEVSLYDSWVKSTANVILDGFGQGLARAERLVLDNGQVELDNSGKESVIADAASCAANAVTMTNSLSATLSLNSASATATPFVAQGLLNLTGTISGTNSGTNYCADLSHGVYSYLSSTCVTNSQNDVFGTPQTDWLNLDGYASRFGEATTNGAVDGVGARVISSNGRMLEKAKFQIAIGPSPGDELITNDLTVGGQIKSYGFFYAQDPAYKEITAHAGGGGSGSATAIGLQTTYVTLISNDHDSAILPLTAAGGAGGVIFAPGTKILDLYPASGKHIFNQGTDLGADTPYSGTNKVIFWTSLNSGNYEIWVP